MRRPYRHTLVRLFSLLSVMSLLAPSPLLARDAAFMDPGAMSSSGGIANVEEAIRADPKGDVDIGESTLNIARRTTLFFANQSNLPVHVDNIAVNGDGNVTAEIINDDCSKQGTIAPLSRCSVEVSVTPTNPGPWSTQILVTHNGAGRIARVKLSGKTSGVTAADKKDNGLALNTKDANPVAFGEVDVGSKAVRSALMVNDSPEAITLYSIDVIEADNGLTRLEQGCAVDMELKPGESCPVTLVWTPGNSGIISTDLIIRHSGHLGFAVIPIRGTSKGSSLSAAMTTTKMESKPSASADKSKDSIFIPSPPTAQELEKATAGKIPSVSSGSLSAPATTLDLSLLRLIGTVGNRAVLLKPDGVTAIAGIGDDVDLGGKSIKITSVGAKSVEVTVDGKKKLIELGVAPELTAKAAGHTKTDAAATAQTQSTPSSLGAMSVPSTVPAVPASALGGGK